MTPSDSLSAIHHFTIAYRFLFYISAGNVQRRVSPVPLTTFSTYRSPYSGKFFRAVIQALHTFLGLHPSYPGSSLPCPSSMVFSNEAAGFTLCYGLLICSHPFGLLCHGASTLGFLHQLSVSYEATWLLPRLDFHQLAINGLLGTQIMKNRPLHDSGRFLFL
jgi:hypothetical protein